MELKFKQKVYYSDTDAYGVVWHGAYLRWLEKGRVDFCENLGLNLVCLDAQNIVLPVVNLNIKYKFPVKINDEVEIITKIAEFTNLSVTFEQTVLLQDKVSLKAFVEVVAVDKAGKLYRKMPEIISDKFKKVLS